MVVQSRYVLLKHVSLCKNNGHLIYSQEFIREQISGTRKLKYFRKQILLNLPCLNLNLQSESRSKSGRTWPVSINKIVLDCNFCKRVLTDNWTCIVKNYVRKHVTSGTNLFP